MFTQCKVTNIPESLRSRGKFCLWRYKEVDGCKKKPSYSVSGENAKPNDESTFSDFATVSSMAGSDYDGVGVGLFGGLAAIDIDHCIDSNTGEISAIAAEIMAIMDSYTERSPSKEGIHILFWTEGCTFDKKKYYTKNSESGVEIYLSGMTSRYMTITGDNINDKDVEHRGNRIQCILDKYMKRPSKVESRTSIPQPQHRDSAAPQPNSWESQVQTLRDREVVRIARTAKNGGKFMDLWKGNNQQGKSESEGDMALCSILAFYSHGNHDQIDRLFRKSWRENIENGKWNRGDYRERTINKAISMCQSYYTPKRKNTLHG